MKTQRSADMTIGAVFTLLGAIVLYGATQIQSMGDDGLKPHVFPMLIGIVILATGIPLLVTALLKGANDPIEWPNREGFKRIAVILVSLTAYIAVIELIGFPIASSIFVAFQVWYLGRDRWYIPLIAGVSSGLVLHFVFIKLLELTLPTGLLY